MKSNNCDRQREVRDSASGMPRRSVGLRRSPTDRRRGSLVGVEPDFLEYRETNFDL